MKIRIGKEGQIMTYETIHVVEFSSARKMMTVVVKELSSGKYLMFTKGAESVIGRLRTESDNDSEVTDQVFQKVDEYGRQGLRTLVFAMREISQSEFDTINWKDEERIPTLIEKDLKILGCTAVMDQLQDDVASCIEDFRQAGIKVWMLTGDMGKTAE